MQMVLRIAVAAVTLASAPSAAAFTAVPMYVGQRGICHQRAAGSSPDEERCLEIPAFVVSPVLAQVYPALIAHKAEHGNPNIPLGNSDGRKCKTLRRLHFQNKLTEEEVNFLEELG